MSGGSGKGSPTAAPADRSPGTVRRLYDWVLGWADHPAGPAAMTGVAVLEASVFPIPPDVLLIPLCLGRPRRSWWFATLCTAGSVAGAVLGYMVGAWLYDAVAEPVLHLYGYMEQYRAVGRLYEQNLVLALGSAGLTPIPFKVFTIAAGGFRVPFLAFVVISAVSRGIRFFVVAWIIRRFGRPAREFAERHLGWVMFALVALLVGGFVLVGFLT